MKYNKKKKVIAFYQIFLLVTLSIAVSFILSENVGFASAQDEDDSVRDVVVGVGVAGATVAATSAIASATGAAVSLTSGAAAVGAHAAAATAVASNAVSAAAASSYSYVVASGGSVVQATAAVEAAALAAGASPAAATVAATETAALAAELLPGVVSAQGAEAASAAGVKLAGGTAGKGVGAAIKGAITGSGGSALVSGLTHAAIWAGAAFIIAKLLGLDSSTTDKLVASAGIGGGTFGVLLGLKGAGAIALTGPAAFGIGLAATAVAFSVMYKKETRKVVSFECLPWEAPLGGNSCEACNSGPIPCSEYRCKSLGQGCELTNQGTEFEACIHTSRGDITAPVITPGSLSPPELSYVAPNNLGVDIEDSRTADGCLQAWTPLVANFVTDEPAKCAWSLNHTDSLDEMVLGFDEGVYKTTNHTLRFLLPNNESGADLAPLLDVNGKFNYFVRCEDSNGNGVDAGEYAVSFCVDESPDFAPPIIRDTSILDESPVAFGADEVPIEVYTNEPAQCRWSRNDQDFDDMENAMSCPTDGTQVNLNLQYVCSDTLTGLDKLGDHNFYFRCEDFAGNEMSSSRELTLTGSLDLNILSTGPNETVTGSSGSVLVDLEVVTDDGANEGRAICFYKTDDYIPSQFTQMLNTDSHEHSQPGLALPPGDYTFDFRCNDAANNIATGSTVFNVQSDQDAPDAIRVYREGNNLKVVTDEDAQCVYNTQSCNYVFSEGLSMNNPSVDDENMHLTPWVAGSTYFVKCMDDFGNQPGANDCSITVKTV